MTPRSPLRPVLLALAILVGATAHAQSPADWIKRILDPAKIGVTPPPGATLNRKLTVDYLSKEDPPAEMAIYTMPLDQLRAASDHFKQTLGVTPETSGSGLFEIHRFNVPAKHLTIMLARSQFVDDKLQITMTYHPPATK
ncbi:MAG: hypothetical protein U0802_12670 [Candidatus Binatia bacterium]